MTRELSSETDKQILEQPLPPPTRADWVEQQLRRDALSGEFAPGERLLATTLVKATPSARLHYVKRCSALLPME